MVPGANTNPTRVPGNSLIHEMLIFVEAGITPMQIIQGATKWSAEMIDRGKDLGTIEAGKLADIVDRQRRSAAEHREPSAGGHGGLQRQARAARLQRRLQPRIQARIRAEPAGRCAVVGQRIQARGLWRAAAAASTAIVRSPGPGRFRIPWNHRSRRIESISPIYGDRREPHRRRSRSSGFNFVRRSQVLFKGVPVPLQSRERIRASGGHRRQPASRTRLARNRRPKSLAAASGNRPPVGQRDLEQGAPHRQIPRLRSCAMLRISPPRMRSCRHCRWFCAGVFWSFRAIRVRRRQR